MASGVAALAFPPPLVAAPDSGFARWVANFKARALARGISEKTYDRVMNAVTPDTSVYALQRSQPEFTEEMWQYINRRCSEWRVNTGRERGKQHGDLLRRIERDYGVDRYVLLGLWGMELSFGDVIENPKYMRQVIPALAALAYGEPRRRKYWEQELLNALTIVDRGWAEPAGMIGSWAGAMGHTQWMPEVWLKIGVDYDKDGRINPFGKPDDALAGAARYLVERGKYQRGEAWGHEVKLPAAQVKLADNRTKRSYEKWQSLGIVRADGKPFDRPNDQARLWLPVRGGPAFLLGQNFFAVRSYNPSSSYYACAASSRRSHSRRRPLEAGVSRRRAAADIRRGQGNPAPAQRAGLQDRRRRRTDRLRHCESHCRFPEESRHGPCLMAMPG